MGWMKTICKVLSTVPDTVNHQYRKLTLTFHVSLSRAGFESSNPKKHFRYSWGRDLVASQPSSFVHPRKVQKPVHFLWQTQISALPTPSQTPNHWITASSSWLLRCPALLPEGRAAWVKDFLSPGLSCSCWALCPEALPLLPLCGKFCLHL